MSSKQINAEPDKIRTHAKNVLSVADSVNEALNAAQTASMPTEAFGKICAFLPPLFVNTVEEDGTSAIKSAGESLDEDATSLNKAAESLQSQDTSNAANLNAVSLPNATS
ncbi:hypothetical protein NRB20_38050 [Nocardia sp. RB20]|uniref:Excreted virulence factor EspC (Type VII ESX diderm) n=2 Tax=Nocardia macrotermitis TaxID=2585198 RepID=A0A7K0D4P6_9NOCA|nr:hypothetical protein [Nocardia macrotermitis]